MDVSGSHCQLHSHAIDFDFTFLAAERLRLLRRIRIFW